MKGELIRNIMSMLPNHPNQAAALFMIYWIARSDPQQRVFVTKKMHDDFRVFVDGCFSMTVMTSLKIVTPANHQECLQSVENDAVYSYEDYPEISRVIELYMEAINSLRRDTNGRVAIRAISNAVAAVATASLEIAI